MAGPSTEQDFDVWQNQDAELTITVTGVTITSATELVWIMSSPEGELIRKTYTSSGGIARTSAAVATVTIDAADLADADVPAGEYPHQLWVTDVNGDVAPVTVGTVTVHKDHR